MITNVAGMVIPCMLSRRTFLWRSAPPFPRPFHPLPRQEITEACNKGLKSYYALSDLVSKFLNPKTLSHLYKTVVCLLLYLDVNSETAYPLLISRNSIPSSTSYVRLHWISQNYVDLTFVNLFWRSTNRCRNWLQKLLFFGRLSIEFQRPYKENISDTSILFSLRFSTDPVWFHTRNSANSSLLRNHELLAKLATGRIIPWQTGLEENRQNLCIIAA